MHVAKKRVINLMVRTLIAVLVSGVCLLVIYYFLEFVLQTWHLKNYL